MNFMTNISLPAGVVFQENAFSETCANIVLEQIKRDMVNLEKVRIWEPEYESFFERVPVMSYGLWWSPIHHTYLKERLPIPTEMLKLAQRLYSQFWKGPAPRIDSIVVNVFENPTDELVMHYDDLENPVILIQGSPVLSLSFGKTCQYNIGSIKGKETDELWKINFKHRSAIFLGDQSRLRKHGISKISQKGPDIGLGKRISITFRQVEE